MDNEVPHSIQCILKERKITDFLEHRNIVPVKQTGDRIIYRCPIHEGDNDPSFIVYLNSEYENYYCFGCHSGISIINLLSDIDNITIREAVKSLLKGLDIDEISDLDNEIKNILKCSIVIQYENSENLFLKINRTVYSYLEVINFNQEEIDFFNKFFEKVDEVARSNDFYALQLIYNFLIDKGIPRRTDMYQESEEKKILEKKDKKEFIF